MARTAPRPPYPLGLRLDAFVERAEKIRQHPLAGRRGDAGTWSPKTKVLDISLYSDESWVPLACLVRPLMFLETDSLFVPKLLNDIGRHSGYLEEAVGRIRSGYKEWLATTFFGLKDDIPHIALDDSGLVALAENNAVEPDEISADYFMATTFLNGELFHVDLDKRLLMISAGQAQPLYKKAAQFRVLGSTTFVALVRAIIEIGRDQEVLPRS